MLFFFSRFVNQFYSSQSKLHATQAAAAAAASFSNVQPGKDWNRVPPNHLGGAQMAAAAAAAHHHSLSSPFLAPPPPSTLRLLSINKPETSRSSSMGLGHPGPPPPTFRSDYVTLRSAVFFFFINCYPTFPFHLIILPTYILL